MNKDKRILTWLLYLVILFLGAWVCSLIPNDYKYAFGYLVGTIELPVFLKATEG